MRYRIMGPLEVLSSDGWMAISAAKWRLLLACLLVRPGQLMPTESLVFELWGDNPPTTANNLVSIYVHRLKKVIGDSEGRILVYRAPGYMLRVAPDDTDFQVFQSLAAEGSSALAVGQHERAAGLLGEALQLWRGPLFADVQPSPLLETQSEHAAELRLTTTELRVEADLGCGRAVRVIPELRGLVREHPLRERLWALLMRALEDAGRRAEALRTYAQAREVIADELGVDPGSQLQRLYAELLAADAAQPSAPPASRRPARVAPDAPRVQAVAGMTSPGTAPGVGGARSSGSPDAATATDPGDIAGGVAEPPESVTEPPGSIAIGTLAESADAPAVDAAEPPAPEEDHGSSAEMARPAQLPSDIGDFTGRATHVARLCALLVGGQAAGSRGAVPIAVVNGAGGLGKTALGVHAAHQVSEQFPDGQLYVDLLGVSAQPAAPGDVLARFLRDLGIAGDKVPLGDDERAALFRTTLAGRRVLILLDNAKDAAQVRPLLPGSSSCAVIVTTRNKIPDLASIRFVDLNVLEDTEALALFSTIVGEERAVAEPDATAEVLVACAGLPLAIRICAARLAARSRWKIATLAGRLRDQHRRLDELTTGDLAVRAGFQVSYDSIKSVRHGADPARAFRLLGLWQGASISLQAAAALLGQDQGDVTEMLESLVDINLLESPAPDWYRFHDLLKVFALERAQAEEPEAVRNEAVSRLLWWYLDTAEAAADTVSPQRYRVTYLPRESSQPALTFATMEAALDWYDDERANIVAATRQAAAGGLHEVASRLPPTLFPLFNRRNNWADCVATHRVAANCAAKVGDQLGEAWALQQVGFALVRMSDPEAFRYLERALAIRQEFGDTRGEAQTAIALGEGHLRMYGPGEEALRYLRRAADLLAPLGASSLRSAALTNLGEVYSELGDLDAAVDCNLEAIDVGRESGAYAEAFALLNLGWVYMRQHRLAEAIDRFDQALPMHRASGALDGEAWTLKGLGAAQAETGSLADARASLTEALRIFELIGERDQSAETAALLESMPTSLDQRLSPPS